MLTWRRGWVGIGTLCLALVAGGASAGDSDPRWQFSIAPYLWAVSIKGTLDAHGVEAEADVGFSDILDTMDAAFLIAFEARRERLSFTGNGIYLKLSDDASGVRGSKIPAAPPGSFDAGYTSETGIVEGFANYEVWSAPLASDERRVALDLRLGARYWYMHEQIDATLLPGVPLGPFHRSFDDSYDWVDGVVGARARAWLSDRLGLVLAGDYGGFGIGSASDPSWAIQGLATFELTPSWQLALGYRHLEVDRDALDLRITGPLVGAIYRF